MRKRKKLENDEFVASVTLNELWKQHIDLKTDIKAYIRSFKVAMWAIAALATILAFFGYANFKSIMSAVDHSVNERLQKTDELLKSIDSEKLKKIQAEIDQKIQRASRADSQLEGLVGKYSKIEDRMFESIPSNQPISYDFNAWTNEDAGSRITIRNNKKVFKKGEEYSFELRLSSEAAKANIAALVVSVYRNAGKQEIQDFISKKFRSAGELNKLPVIFNTAPGVYEMRIGYVLVSTDATERVRFVSKKSTIEVAE